ncbi:ABC transporter permease [Bacteroidota bacterium]
MLRSFIKFAFRIGIKDKFHSIINIIGLASGLACSIIILLYVQNEISYDRHHENYRRIYAYAVEMTIGGNTSTQTSANPIVGPRMIKEYPEIEAFTRFRNMRQSLIKFEEKEFYENNFVWADSSITKIFTFDFIYGDPKTCLKNFNTIVLTESVSKKIFGQTNPVGEVIEIENQGLFTVTAVVKDQPENTFISFDALLSYSTLQRGIDQETLMTNVRMGSGMSDNIYFLFRNEINPEEFYKKLTPFYQKYLADNRIEYTIQLESIKDIYLNSKLFPEFSSRNKKALIGFASVGFFVLLLACINYINLATSRMSNRVREVGIRKVIGSGKKYLIIQFLGESVIISFLALIIALGITEFILGFTSFNELISKNLELNFFSNKLILFCSISLTLLVGLLSGLYPSIYMARVKPISAFREKIGKFSGGTALRSILFSIQCIVSIGVITMILLMKMQINYVMDADLGFNKKDVVIITVQDDTLRRKLPILRDKLMEYDKIESAAVSEAIPSLGITGYAFEWESQDGDFQLHAFRFMSLGPEYFKTMGIELVNGRGFDINRASEANSIIVNEALVNFLKWDNPIGKVMRSRGFSGEVIGVVRDFHFASLHRDIQPLFVNMTNVSPSILSVRLNNNFKQESIDLIRQNWEEVAPDFPFEYEFLEDRLDTFYTADERQKKLYSIFSYFCILISCLGLLGLTSYITEKRTKETAIRKAHGARIFDIIFILSKNIIVLVTLSSIISIPIIYFFFNKWLGNFAFQQKINPLIFVATTLAALLIAFIISSYYTLKIARKNPIDSLKYE